MPDIHQRTKRAVVQRLQSLQAAGVQQMAKPAAGGARVGRPSAADPEACEMPSQKEAAPQAAPVANRQRAGRTGLFDTSAPPPGGTSTAPNLEVLQQEVAVCTLCSELASTRTQTVFGVGDPRARLCFMGEAPGADEDRLGEPFVGRAGQLLNKIIEACGMTRQQVYILNVIKCRPPGNRNPATEEARNCRRYLNRQLDLIQPEFICCLGAVAAQNLLDTTVSIGRLRGRVHDYRGIKVVCTYHPAYLLRNPAAKKPTWEDMKLLLGEMGLPVPGKE